MFKALTLLGGPQRSCWLGYWVLQSSSLCNLRARYLSKTFHCPSSESLLGNKTNKSHNVPYKVTGHDDLGQMNHFPYRHWHHLCSCAHVAAANGQCWWQLHIRSTATLGSFNHVFLATTSTKLLPWVTSPIHFWYCLWDLVINDSKSLEKRMYSPSFPIRNSLTTFMETHTRVSIQRTQIPAMTTTHDFFYLPPPRKIKWIKYGVGEGRKGMDVSNVFG